MNEIIYYKKLVKQGLGGYSAKMTMPKDILDEQNWVTGDTLEIISNPDLGEVKIRKKAST
jgi:hypothetical protein